MKRIIELKSIYDWADAGEEKSIYSSIIGFFSSYEKATEQINNTLKSLSSLKGIEFVSLDYNDVDIPLNSIVYCDIPYKDTKQYETSKNFDYEKFYEWCRKNRRNYKIFISEYSMPSDFICVWQKEITNAMNQTKTYKPIERLYTI